jgi:uncharacterized protein YjdB
VGGTQQFVATGHYSDSSTHDITTQATWNSANQLVATISSTGLAKGVSSGPSVITATFEGKSSNTTLTVSFTPLTYGYLYFDGSDRVVVSNSNSLNPSQVTVELWVYLSRIIPSGSNQFLLAKGDDGTQGSYYLSQNGDQFHFYIGANGVDQIYAQTIPLSLQTNRWYHVAGTYDGSNLNIYVDGVLKGTTSGIIIIGNSLPLTLGCQNRSGVNYYLNGGLKEVRVWNLARTASEIQSSMNSILTGSESGLVAYWHLNEGSGQVAHDSTSYGNNGQLGSSPGIDTDDPTWKGPTLSYITVTPASPSIGVGATEQFTATGTYSDSTTVDLTSSSTWTSSDTGIATINPTTGLAMAVGAGTSTIKSTLGGISGSTTLTVSLPWSSDNFDSYQLGTFPSSGGWILRYNGAGDAYQYVDNTHSVSGTQSMHLVGSSCWGAAMYHPLNFPSQVMYEANVFVDAIVSCGCTPELAVIRLENPSIGTWGTDYGSVVFNCDGNIYARRATDGSQDVNLMPYNAQQWYDVELNIDLVARTFDVYVNGVLKGSGFQILDSGVPTGIEVGAAHGGNPTVWFDDVRVQ